MLTLEDKRELALKMMLRDFVLRHPGCEERHRQALGVSESSRA